MLHDWFIEQREYDRQETRRGHRHAFGTLDPRRAALVVVDLVPFFFDDDNAYVPGVVPHVNALARALRDGGGHVAWVVPANTEPTARETEFFGPRIAALYARTGGEGRPRERVHADLDTHDDDLFAEKTVPSAFFPGTCDLHEQLRACGVDTVLVTGTVTNVCVEATVRDAAALGYRVVLVADGCAARRDQDHNATLHTVYRTFGDVRPTAEVLELIAQGRTV